MTIDRTSENLSRTAVIIPALNEADNLRELLPALGSLCPGEIIVGDNGSTDGTSEVAWARGATAVVELKRGYGAACAAALRCMTDDVEFVVFIDADQSDDYTLIPSLVCPIARNECDLVIGHRIPVLRQPGSMTLPQRFGDRLATRLVRWGWGFEYFDLGPFRAIRRESLDRLDLRDRAFGWTIEMQIRAIEEGLRIVQLPVPYRRRVGRSKISGTVRGVILAGYWILSTWWRLWRTRRQRCPCAHQ